MSRIRTELELESPVMAELELKLFRYLRKKLKFDPWHTLTTIYSREYAKWIVRNVNSILDGSGHDDSWCIEVGCGLGEIIGNIRWKHKAGYDLDVGAVRAARMLRAGRYFTGTFGDIEIKEKADRPARIKVLIITNFIHNIPPEALKADLDILLRKYAVEYIVLDTVRGGSYRYYQKGDYLFSGKYEIIKSSERYTAADGALRREEIWRIINTGISRDRHGPNSMMQ